MKYLIAGALFAAGLIAPAELAAEDATAPPAPAIVQDYEPDPAIWMLRDEDTTIYLLGTVHILPEGFRWRSSRLDGIVEEADELIVETTDEDAGGAAELVAGLAASMAKRPPVSASLSPGNRKKWLALAALAGMPPEQFDRMPPLMTIFGIATTSSSSETGARSEFGVETVLEEEFRRAGKPIGSIEDAGDLVAALLALDERLLIKDIDRSLSRWDGRHIDAIFGQGPAKHDGAVPEAALTEEHAWAQGEDIDISGQFDDGGIGKVLGKLLLDNRNRAWAGWLERRLAEPGTVLVAVGAGHLAGDTSVQAMLTERGLTAVRLD
jgi:hypothetical protein